MRYIDIYAEKLDILFELGTPTKTQLYDAFHKAHPCSLDDIDNYNVKQMRERKDELGKDIRMIMMNYNIPESWQQVLRKKINAYGFLKFRLDTVKKLSK